MSRLPPRSEESLESDNLPDPGLLAQENVEDLEAALEPFRETAVGLGSKETAPSLTAATA